MRTSLRWRRAGSHHDAATFNASSLDNWSLRFLSLAVSGIALLSAALLAAMFA